MLELSCFYLLEDDYMMISGFCSMLARYDAERLANGLGRTKRE